MAFAVNGKFTSQSITGVQRIACIVVHLQS